MGLLSRIFGIGKAEANAALDKLEDPVKITEQQIRDMKDKLGDVIKAQATSLANLNKLKSRQKEFLLVQEDYTKKAQGVKAKIESGATDDETGKKAIIAALNKADNAKKSAESLAVQIKASQSTSDKITANVATFKKSITEAENTLVTLKARAESAKANRDINKQLSDVDPDGYASNIQRMVDKVDGLEAEAAAYEQINDENKSEDEIIESALAGDSPTADDELYANFMNESK